MTAAARSTTSAPMTVARGGHEGAPARITHSFSSKNAFTSKEGGYGKAMSIGKNPLSREISIGKQPAPTFAKLTQFTNPDSIGRMSTINVDSPYKGNLLQSRSRGETIQNKNILSQTAPLSGTKTETSDRQIPTMLAKEMVQGKNTVTLFERAKVQAPSERITKQVTTEQVKSATPAVTEPKVANKSEIIAPPVKPAVRKAPSLSEIGLEVIKKESRMSAKPVETSQAGEVVKTLGELRKNEIEARDTSLVQVRKAMQQVAQPVRPEIQHAQPETTRNVLIAPQLTRTTQPNKETRRLTPLEKIQEKVAKKSDPKPYISIINKNEQAGIILKSIDTPKMTDKEVEKGILTKYLTQHILPESMQKDLSSEQAQHHNEMKKRMVTYLTSPQKKDGGSQLETQLLGDNGNTTEQVAMQKIEEFIKETRVNMQMAKAAGGDAVLIEEKAMTQLHEKIQEAGLLTIFMKVKTIVTQEIATDTAGKEATSEKVIPVRKVDEEEEKESKEERKSMVRIELDTFADRFRRAYMKMKAHTALEKAQEKGRKQVSTAEIAKEIGTYQYHFTKSEPVRYTNRPDGSITETLQALNQSAVLVSTTDEADQVIDREIDHKAPVRITPKIKSKPRGLLDLIRVMGYPKEMKDELAA